MVLWRAFWLQSMNTRPGRRLRFMAETTSSGRFFSMSWATAWAKEAAWSWPWGVLRGT